MKKIILTTMTVILMLGICSAQDMITKKTGEDIQAKISEITPTQIKYYRFDNLNGPIYTIDKSEVLMIRYENGTKDIFNDSNKATEITTVIADDIHSNVRQNANSNHRYKNRIGLNGGGGSGFKNIQVLTLSDGTKASISFGGGTVVNFEYGHEFSKHFDLAINIGGQFSELSKTVDNGSMTCNRTILSLTPSYILPIGGEDKMSLRFGAGIDWIYFVDLDFDLSKISGGVKDDWKYNAAIGEHVSVIFEYNTPKRFAFTGGLRLHNAKYEFNSGNSSYPTDDDVKYPNGSGIDFIIGAYYRFNWIK